MQSLSLLVCLACILHLCVSKAHSSTDEKLFKRCCRGFVSANAGHTTYARSPLQCIVMCSKTQTCSGADICPEGQGRGVTCDLNDDVSFEGCTNLIQATVASCFHIYKKQHSKDITTEADVSMASTQEPTTTALACQNGGTADGNRCNCPAQYAGINCQRYIRDCSEAFANGELYYEGVFIIQPVTSAQPFKVYCVFAWGGVTSVLRRTDTSNFNQNWTVLRDEGIGQDPSGFNYFAGLENIHHLTQQATYELNINLHTGYSILYDNFTVGPDSTSYTLSYSFRQTHGVYNDVFSALKPVQFSASDNDVNHCYGQRGVAGWYGTDCAGYTLFSNGAFNWPDAYGNDQWITRVDFRFVRQSGDYV